MSKGKGFLTPMTFGVLTGAALSVAAFSMSNSRARKAVRKQANRAVNAIGDIADDLGNIISK